MSYIGYSHATHNIAPPFIREVLSPNGSATYFDLTNDVPGYHEENIMVLVNHVVQEPISSYTIINDAYNRPRRLDFAGTALASTDKLYVIHRGVGTLTSTPAAGSVTKTAMAANMVSHVVDKFVGSEATVGSTTLALSETPTTADSISVYVNGVYQRSGSGGSNNYSVSGSNLVFTSALTATDQIDIHHHTFRSTTTNVADTSVGTTQLTDLGVTTAKLAANAVTSAKLDTNIVIAGNLTVSGTTTTVDTTLTLSDAMVINNAGSDVGLKINSTSTGNIVQLQDGGVDKFVIADGGNLTYTGAATITGTLAVSSTTTFNGDAETSTTKKIKQKGAFLQSSTHQAIVLGL